MCNKPKAPKKRKGGRPRKYPLAEGAVPNTPAQVSEVEAWEKEMEAKHGNEKP